MNRSIESVTITTEIYGSKLRIVIQPDKTKEDGYEYFGILIKSYPAPVWYVGNVDPIEIINS